MNKSRHPSVLLLPHEISSRPTQAAHIHVLRVLLEILLQDITYAAHTVHTWYSTFKWKSLFPEVKSGSIEVILNLDAMLKYLIFFSILTDQFLWKDVLYTFQQTCLCLESSEKKTLSHFDSCHARLFLKSTCNQLLLSTYSTYSWRSFNLVFYN